MDTLKKLSMATKAAFLAHRDTKQVNSRFPLDLMPRYETEKTLNQQQKYQTASQGGSWHRTLPIAVTAATWLISASSAEAVDIQLINVGTLNGSSSIANNIRYQGQSQPIVSFTDTNNDIWTLAGGSTPTLILRRGSGTSFDDRQVFFAREQEPLEPATSEYQYTVLPAAPPDTQGTLAQNNIFLGTDNLFSNTGNRRGNNSNVERLDVIFNDNTPVTATANRAVTVFERGVLSAHDGFRIAAITGVSDSTPLSYGQLVNFNAGSWGQQSLTGNRNYRVFNNSSGSFGVSDQLTQDVGGTVIRLTDLVSPGTPIFGYSLFALDVPTNGDLVSWNSFRTDTPESTGGIDLVAANLGVVEVPFKFSPSLGLLILGATWGVQSLWQRNRIKPIKDLRGDRRLS